jgi:hypothetical protein
VVVDELGVGEVAVDVAGDAGALEGDVADPRGARPMTPVNPTSTTSVAAKTTTPSTA